jgi:hypothetical protein
MPLASSPYWKTGSGDQQFPDPFQDVASQNMPTTIVDKEKFYSKNEDIGK